MQAARRDLGERYVWVPETIPPELIEREPWLLAGPDDPAPAGGAAQAVDHNIPGALHQDAQPGPLVAPGRGAVVHEAVYCLGN